MAAPTHPLMARAAHARDKKIEMCMLIQAAHVAIKERREAEEREKRAIQQLAVVGPYVELNPDGTSGHMELSDPHLVECQGIRFETPPLVCSQVVRIRSGREPCVTFEWYTDMGGFVRRDEELGSPSVHISEAAQVVEAEPVRWHVDLAKGWVEPPRTEKDWERTIWNLRGTEGWRHISDLFSLQRLSMFRAPIDVRARSEYSEVRQCNEATVTLGWCLKLR